MTTLERLHELQDRYRRMATSGFGTKRTNHPETDPMATRKRGSARKSTKTTTKRGAKLPARGGRKSGNARRSGKTARSARTSDVAGTDTTDTDARALDRSMRSSVGGASVHGAGATPGTVPSTTRPPGVGSAKGTEGA